MTTHRIRYGIQDQQGRYLHRDGVNWTTNPERAATWATQGFAQGRCDELAARSPFTNPAYRVVIVMR